MNESVSSMKRVLCVWEFGGGLGHIGQLMPVAKVLRDRGCEVTFVCRTLDGVAAWLGKEGFPFIQAPHAPITPGAAARPVSFASILAAVGFSDRERLCLLVEGWRSLFRLAQPDVLIINYAPIAQLAARLLSIPSVEIGEGFSIPPHEYPFPPFSPADAAPMEEEETALAVTNEVLRQYGAPGLDRLCDVHSSERVFLCTFSELDHYRLRSGGDYCGALFSVAEGVPPAWKNTGRTKVFAYLKTDYPGVTDVISRLGNLDLDCLLFLSGRSPSLCAHAETVGIAVSGEPVDLQAVATSCDVGICHSGPGTTIALLLGGKPVLLLPMQFEQSLTATNAQRARLGRWLKPNFSVMQFDHELRQLIESSESRAAAQAFKAKYAGFDHQRLAATIAESALNLMTQS